ncbi:hypothetical protein IQ244_29840 [Nostoc sp. LEGE 06077]|uniref:hypothetical protein n=1 Tax=Nostoc sp. LEGE 06077 TaxID=915325 RepID=UPI00187E7E36|nr:hypothetical protein [Nostoc sp. LEGE 06077]MBE9210631.1 hypothetical protein [Nostoc sp. LEGE 06077]
MPTGRVVKDAVQKIMERTNVLNTYQVDEVCQILTKDNPELRGRAAVWQLLAK